MSTTESKTPFEWDIPPRSAPLVAWLRERLECAEAGRCSETDGDHYDGEAEAYRSVLHYLGEKE